VNEWKILDQMMRLRTITILVWIIPLTGVVKAQTQEGKTERDSGLNSIINLYDAFGEEKEGLTWDFGFSCLVKYNGRTILFDSGTNADIFKRNVETLGVDLRKVDYVVASHAHFDHINGFDYLLEINPDVEIYFPFDPFWGANIPFDVSGQEPGVADSLEMRMRYFQGDYETCRFNQSGRFWKANVQFIRQNSEIEPGVKLIATSSPYMGYFSKYPNLDIDESGMAFNNDLKDNTTFIPLQEISLSLETDEGEVIVVGCSHSTVEKIIMETKNYTENDIALVYGGYHLLPYKREVLQQMADRLKNDLGVKRVAPAHCTGHLAFRTLKMAYGEHYLFAGLGEELKF
jgi:7,8-dihydropterin-6-yl-methyl-4-(beta-D-ribofuranosyl)aminobenzene 5'-phosphate synthase